MLGEVVKDSEQWIWALHHCRAHIFYTLRYFRGSNTTVWHERFWCWAWELDWKVDRVFVGTEKTLWKFTFGEKIESCPGGPESATPRSMAHNFPLRHCAIARTCFSVVGLWFWSQLDVPIIIIITYTGCSKKVRLFDQAWHAEQKTNFQYQDIFGLRTS